MVKNSPCNSGCIGSTPGQETKIPHAMEQLSPARMKHDKLQVKLSLHITLILFNKFSPPHSNTGYEGKGLSPPKLPSSPPVFRSGNRGTDG